MKRTVSVLTLVAVAWPLGLSAQTFVLRSVLEVDRPFSLLAAHFNQDSYLDIAVLDTGSHAVILFRNNSDGTFVEHPPIGVGTNPRWGSAGDFDGDSDLDIAVANHGSDSVSILQNDGHGNFIESEISLTASGPLSATAADLDGDSDLDLAVSANGSGNGVNSGVLVLTNDGVGGFTETFRVDVPGCEFPLGSGDWDGDADIDLAVPTHCSFGTHILENDGAGAFTLVSSVTSGSYPSFIGVGDLDGDLDLDLATPNRNDGSYSNSTLTILGNDGSGSFSVTGTPPVGGDHPVGIAVGDIDGDGDPDLAAPMSNQEGGGAISLLVNDGLGQFTELLTVGIELSSSAVLGDFDGDGALDLAATQAPNAVHVWTQSDDSDGDGVPDDQDICPGGDDNADGDGDGVPDFCDPCPADAENDADGDGVCGDVDVCPGGNDNDNADGDSLPDFCDVCPYDPENDADGDGICELQDNCPITWNPSQADNDSDDQGDACDTDDDNDGVIDSEDNCQFVGNPAQEDFDEDGAGDACDTDDDGDGTLDAVDECPETTLGDAVSANGCSIAQLCPCAHPDGADRWKNHGAYVSCVAHTSEVFVDLGLITEAEKDAIVSAAGASNCGHKPR